MQFLQAFPIAIIDEDYEGKHAAGRGMRQLAAAIENEGFRVVAGISYKDALRLGTVFNNESCWLISIDGAETGDEQWKILEEVLAAKRKRNVRLPIFLFGDERTAEMVPAGVLKHANAFMRLFEDSAEFLARAVARSAQLYLERIAPPANQQVCRSDKGRGSGLWRVVDRTGGAALEVPQHPARYLCRDVKPTDDGQRIGECRGIGRGRAGRHGRSARRSTGRSPGVRGTRRGSGRAAPGARSARASNLRPPAARVRARRPGAWARAPGHQGPRARRCAPRAPPLQDRAAPAPG